MNSESFLNSLLEKEGIKAEKRQLCQFIDYHSLLVEWNEKINLTAITEFEDVCLKHFADSLALINLFNDFDEIKAFLSGKSLADIGTGAGFPGIPLKILFPDLKVTLFDSLDKRVRFLNTVISELGLEDIVAVHGRAEELAHVKQYREAFDLSAARAVAALPVLSEYCIPFVKKNGYFIAYKSDVAEELSQSENALKLLCARVVVNKNFLLPESDYKRTILMIEKVESTDSKYPRKAGKPLKNPL